MHNPKNFSCPVPSVADQNPAGSHLFLTQQILPKSQHFVITVGSNSKTCIKQIPLGPSLVYT